MVNQSSQVSNLKCSTWTPGKKHNQNGILTRQGLKPHTLFDENSSSQCLLLTLNELRDLRRWHPLVSFERLPLGDNHTIVENLFSNEPDSHAHWFDDTINILCDGAGFELVQVLYLHPNQAGGPLLSGPTVINRLMIHHHPMIHFCILNNFLRKFYFFMKQISIEAFIYCLSTPTVWTGLNKNRAQDISFKNVCFMDLAKNTATS